MVQSFRSDLRQVPLRRGLADVVRASVLAVAVGLMAFLAAQHFSGETWVRPFPNDGIAAETQASTANSQPAESFEIVTLDGETHLNDAAQAFLFPSVLSAERQVVLRRPVDIAALLDSGEVMPSVKMAPVFAASRVASIADAECARLIMHVAAECSLAKAEVVEMPGNNDDTTFDVTLRLNFTPRTATGQLPGANEMQFGRRILVAERLPDGVASGINQDRTGGAYFEFVYADAEAACAEVRRALGNCSIMKIDAEFTPTGESRTTYAIGWMEPAQQLAEGQPVKPAG